MCPSNTHMQTFTPVTLQLDHVLQQAAHTTVPYVLNTSQTLLTPTPA